MLMWVMSDRAIPRSFRFMEGFGVHTFRFVNAARPVDVREVPLEAEAGPAVGAVGRGGEDQRRRPRLPPPRPLGRDRRGRLPRVGARHPALRRRLRRRVRLRRARPHQAHPRGARAGPSRSAAWCSTGWSTTSSPRPSRSRSAPRTSSPASTSPTTRCCRAATSPTSTPSSSGSAAPTSPTCRSTPRSARWPTSSRTATWRWSTPSGGSTTSPTRGPATSAGPARTRPAASRPSPRPRRARSAGSGRSLRRPLQPGRPVLPQPDAGRAAAHRRRLHLRAQQGRGAGDPRADGRQPAQRRRRPRRGGRRPASAWRAARRRSPAAAEPDLPRAVAGAEHPGPTAPTRSPAASSACWSPTGPTAAVGQGAAARRSKAEGTLIVEVVAPTIGGVTLDDGTPLPGDQMVGGGPSVLYDAVAVVRLRRTAPPRWRRCRRPSDFVTDAHAHAKFVGHTPEAAALFEAAGITEPRRRLRRPLEADVGQAVHRGLPGGALLGPRGLTTGRPPGRPPAIRCRRRPGRRPGPRPTRRGPRRGAPGAGRASTNGPMPGSARLAIITSARMCTA